MADANVHPIPETPFDASNPEHVEKRKLQALRQEKEQREVFATLLSAPAGRNWLWRFLEDLKMFSTTFVPGMPDASVYNEGRRSVAIQFWADLERAAPDALILMRKERGQA